MNWYSKRFQTKPRVAKEDVTDPTAPRDKPSDEEIEVALQGSFTEVEKQNPKKRRLRRSRWPEEDGKS